ncbi:hypothetical protein JCM3765_007166 [Sporobolomyces pararoseus]
MTGRQLKVLDLAIPYLSPPTLSPLERPSLRYSTLLKLSLLSRSIHSHVESRLYAEIFISAGNSQLVPLLKAIMSNKSLAQQINKLSFVSRHKQVEKWDLDRIEKIVEMCTEVRESVMAIPTTFGLKENFLSSTSLANLRSLTLATPIRPSISSPAKPPLFNLTTLSILPPFNSSFALSFTPTLSALLAPRSSIQDQETTCSLSKLVNLSLSDSRRHPLKVPPLLAPTVSSTLRSLALPRFTHFHSYESTLQGEFGIREAREQPRFSCDPPITLHPSRKFLDHFSSRTIDSKLKYVYLANLGHLGMIHHLPKSHHRITKNGYSSAPSRTPVEIFSNLTSSPPDLYHTLLACKTFCQIIKPILYQHITFTTRQQRSRLLKVKKEDKRLVEKLMISGEGWIDPIDVENHFDVEDCALGKNAVKDLLTGKLLDITAIRILHIWHVHEDPSEVLGSKLSPFDLRPALKLVELSIWIHQGRGGIWNVYLGYKLPSLRQLTYYHVTEYIREANPIPFASRDNEPDPLVEVQSRLPPRTPYSQLQAIAALPFNEYPEIRNFPIDRFLAIFHIEALLILDTFPNPFPHCRLILATKLKRVYFPKLLQLVQEGVSSSDNRLVSLLLSKPPESVNEEDYKKWNEALKSKGVDVIEEAAAGIDVSTSRIPSSFIHYLEKNGKFNRD